MPEMICLNLLESNFWIILALQQTFKKSKKEWNRYSQYFQSLKQRQFNSLNKLKGFGFVQECFCEVSHSYVDSYVENSHFGVYVIWRYPLITTADIFMTSIRQIWLLVLNRFLLFDTYRVLYELQIIKF